MSYINNRNAMLSLFMHIPFPEQLDFDTWLIKVQQLKWLEEKNMLPVKIKRK